jgi:hypothetical protein
MHISHLVNKTSEKLFFNLFWVRLALQNLAGIKTVNFSRKIPINETELTRSFCWLWVSCSKIVTRPKRKCHHWCAKQEIVDIFGLLQIYEA